MTKDTLCKKTNMNHVIRKPSVFLFLCHAGRHCHFGVSNGGKRKRSVKLSFSSQKKPQRSRREEGRPQQQQ